MPYQVNFENSNLIFENVLAYFKKAGGLQDKTVLIRKCDVVRGQ